MSLRPLLNAALVFILVVVSGWLIYIELRVDPDTGRNRIAPTAEETQHQKRAEDPLIEIRYVKANRESNFKAFGMSEEMVKATFDRTRRLEEHYTDKLKLMIQDAAEPVLLGDALCGDSPTIRPRYAATRFFIEQEQTVRRPIDLRRATLLERQDWSVTSPIDAVYASLELIEDRQEDATIMGVAAIILGQEQDAIDRHKPWGRSLVTGGWSYDTLKDQHRNIDEYLVKYFALMHVAAEMAQAEEGICAQ